MIQRPLALALCLTLLVACERDEESPSRPPSATATNQATPPVVASKDAAHDVQTPPCAKPEDADKLLKCKDKCDKGGLVSCVGLGRAYVLARDPDLAPDTPLIKACEGGLAEGCTALGDILVVKDAPAAVASWRRGCEGGHSIGCQRAGFELEMGKTVAMDREAASTLYDRACSLGLTLGCVSRGYALRSGYAGDPKPKEAMGYFERACAKKDLMGCTFQGIMLYEGAEGVPQDKAASKPLLEKGCAVDARACSFLAELQFEAGAAGLASLAAVDACTRGGVPMCVTHIPATTKACDDEDAIACYALATLLDLGVSLKDPKRPAVNTRRNAALERACSLGQGAACMDLGEFTEKGFYGIEKNPRRARVLYGKGCKLEHEASCKALEMLR